MKYLEQGTKNILLATDFTQQAQRAFDAAVRMARVFGARLHILHVNEEEFFFGAHSSGELTRFVDQVILRRSEWMNTFENAAKDLGVDCKSLILDGVASETILATADEIDAGLIVIGTTGAHELNSLLPGSTARRVLRQAQRPVLSISPKAGVAPAEDKGTFEHLLYPTDLSKASLRGLALAKMLVERTRARLTLVNVLRLPKIIPSIPGEVPIIVPSSAAEHLIEKMGEQMLAVESSLSFADVDTRVEVHVDPAHGIADVAREEGFDLIAIPRHSSRRISSYLFGRTAETLAKIAPVPVLLFTPQ